jgi:hypothetical protein
VEVGTSFKVLPSMAEQASLRSAAIVRASAYVELQAGSLHARAKDQLVHPANLELQVYHELLEVVASNVLQHKV